MVKIIRLLIAILGLVCASAGLGLAVGWPWGLLLFGAALYLDIWTTRA